jgi:hypothetical protein
MESKFSPFLTGFRKNNSTQQALLKLIESWKTFLNKGFLVGTLIMDLSKAFDTLNHDLLIAKLSAYGFDKNSIIFIKSYLTGRQQRCKINNIFSAWLAIKTGVPQGSILGPLFFNIFINDLFFSIDKCNICNYADDNTLYSGRKYLHQVISDLKHDFTNLNKWFFDNSMVLNPEKCHFMLLGHNGEVPDFVYGDIILKNSKIEKILGITIDHKLNFEQHVKNICIKSNQKLCALSRVSSHMNFLQKKLIFNSLIKSQFSYCPIIWMFCSKTSLFKINNVHKKALQITFNDYISTFDELLSMANDKTIHQNSINILLTEVFKFMNGYSPKIMNEIFIINRIPYNLRAPNIFITENPHSNRFGLDTVLYRSNQLWNTLPIEIKQSTNLFIFKNKIKKWKCTNCQCSLCRVYIAGVGFIN